MLESVFVTWRTCYCNTFSIHYSTQCALYLAHVNLPRVKCNKTNHVLCVEYAVKLDHIIVQD